MSDTSWVNKLTVTKSSATLAGLTGPWSDPAVKTVP
jgi:hypothetical protein